MRSGAFTAEQQEILTALFQVVDFMAHHTARQAVMDTKTTFIALPNLLVANGIVTEQKWDNAIDTVEAERQVLEALDPELQHLLAEIRRVFGPHEGEAEGGQ